LSLGVQQKDPSHKKEEKEEEEKEKRKLSFKQK
jgi:hypothetical protein